MVIDNLNKHKDLKKNFDFPLFFLVLATALFGIIMISSASPSPVKHVVVQSGALVLGIGMIGILMVLDYEYLADLMLYLYGISVILLILVLIPGIGKLENGARSWFRFGSAIGIQPAELVKLAFIITFARHLSEVDDLIDRPRNVMFLLLHAGLLIGLILLVLAVLGFFAKRLYDNYYVIRHDIKVRRQRRSRFRPIQKKKRRRRRSDRMFK